MFHPATFTFTVIDHHFFPIHCIYMLLNLYKILILRFLFNLLYSLFLFFLTEIFFYFYLFFFQRMIEATEKYHNTFMGIF